MIVCSLRKSEYSACRAIRDRPCCYGVRKPARSELPTFLSIEDNFGIFLRLWPIHEMGQGILDYGIFLVCRSIALCTNHTLFLCVVRSPCTSCAVRVLLCPASESVAIGLLLAGGVSLRIAIYDAREAEFCWFVFGFCLCLCFCLDLVTYPSA